MSLDPVDMFFSIVFGLLGFCYLVYGKRSQSFFFIICGVGLMAYTMVTGSTAQVIGFGAALAIAPFILDRLF